MKFPPVKFTVWVVCSVLLSTVSAWAAEEASDVQELAVKIVEKDFEDREGKLARSWRQELPPLQEELTSLASKDIETARLITEVKQRNRQGGLLGPYVLTDLVWHAARFCKFKMDVLKKDFPALVKESGAIGIVYEKNPVPRVVVDQGLVPWLTMVFYEGGELRYVQSNKANDYRRPVRYEIKEMNGQLTLVSYHLDRRMAGDTEDTELIDYYSISEEGFKHLKSEQRHILFSDKPADGK